MAVSKIAILVSRIVMVVSKIIMLVSRIVMTAGIIVNERQALTGVFYDYKECKSVYEE